MGQSAADGPTADLPGDKDALLARLDRAWVALEAAIDGWSEGQLGGPTDEQGWTGLDHLGNLAAWERSMAFLLRGEPRHAGLGVPESVYLGGDEDAINAAIRARTPERSLAATRADLRDAHADLLAALSPRSYTDLLRPYAHYLPDEPGEDDGSPILHKVLANTEEHYPEHLGWIAGIVGR